MTFQQLQYLIEARKAGSISQAAKNLFLTPSSVSVAITTLEQELGYPVFVRTAQGLIPTTEGEKVLKYANRIMENYRLLEGVQVERKTVCLNLSDYDALGAAFARLVKEKQGSDLAFVVTNDALETVIQRLLANEVELDVRFAFSNVARKLEIAAENQGLSWNILATVPVAARVGPEHPLYHAVSVAPKELEKYAMIEPASRSLSKSTILKGFISFDVNKTIASSSSAARRWLISEGLGYSIVPRLVSDELDKRFNLRKIPIEGLQYRLYALYNHRYPQRPEVKRYLELLQEQLTKETPAE